MQERGAPTLHVSVPLETCTMSHSVVRIHPGPLTRKMGKFSQVEATWAKWKDEMDTHLDKIKATVTLVRILFMIPAPLMLTAILLLDDGTRATRPVSIARLAVINVIGSFIIFSRMIVRAKWVKSEQQGKNEESKKLCRQYITWWTWDEIFEGFLAMGASICSIFLTMKENGTGGYGSAFVTSLLLTMFIFAVVFTWLHPMIEKIKKQQEKEYFGFIQNTVKEFATVLMVLCVFCIYSMFVTGKHRLQIYPGSEKLIPLALSDSFSCVNKSSFERAFKNTTYEKEGCPYTSDGSLLSPWCGFSSWEEACREMSVTPALGAIHNGGTIFSFQLCIFVSLRCLFVGLGMTGTNEHGSIQTENIMYLLEPRTMFVYSAASLNMLLVIYVIVDLMILGPYVTAEMPRPLPAKFKLPGFCFGDCSDTIYYGFVVLWALTALNYIVLHVVKTGKREIDLKRSKEQKQCENLISPTQKTTLLEGLKKRQNNQSGSGANKFFISYIAGDINAGTMDLKRDLLGIKEDENYNAKNLEQAIVKEVNNLTCDNCDQIKETLKYIIHEEAEEKEDENGNGIRDEGNNGKRLEDFMKTTECKKAKLERHHVIALRLYTTQCYKVINDSLRERGQLLSVERAERGERGERGNPHPLPATVLSINEGIKRLRDLAIKDSKNILWRGLKVKDTNLEFVQHGGIEFAPMSTTKNFDVAVKYATNPGGHSLLFKIIVEDINDCGADLRWLSVFGSEDEVLFPPKIKLKPTGKIQSVNENVRIMEMRAHILSD